MKKGEKEYITKTEKELAILNSLDAIPVQRNSGIDGFLKEYYQSKPVPIKIQKETETFEEARDKLLKASKKRDCILKILIKTKHEESLFDFIRNDDLEDNLIVIDSYDLVINEWIRKNGKSSELVLQN